MAQSLGTGCGGAAQAFSPSHRELLCAIYMNPVAKEQNLKQFEWHLMFQSVISFIEVQSILRAKNLTFNK